jgi:hypothetical protein
MRFHGNVDLSYLGGIWVALTFAAGRSTLSSLDMLGQRFLSTSPDVRATMNKRNPDSQDG